MRHSGREEKVRSSFSRHSIGAEVFFDRQPDAMKEAVGQGRNIINGFVKHNTFDAPHGQKHPRQSDVALASGDHLNPIVKGVEINAAQVYARRVQLFELAPKFFFGAMQIEDDGSTDGHPIVILFVIGHSISLSFNDHSDALPAADTERRQPALHVASLHFIEQGDENARTARADGVAKSNRAAVNVDTCSINA